MTAVELLFSGLVTSSSSEFCRLYVRENGICGLAGFLSAAVGSAKVEEDVAKESLNGFDPATRLGQFFLSPR